MNTKKQTEAKVQFLSNHFQVTTSDISKGVDHKHLFAVRGKGVFMVLGFKEEAQMISDNNNQHPGFFKNFNKIVSDQASQHNLYEVVYSQSVDSLGD